MRILHSYCLNYNLGDYALGIGLKNLLRSFLPVDFIGNTNIQGREFNEYYINEVVNKRYDFLVLGGGGLIHGSHWPNGWFWLIKQELIKQIKIPFMLCLFLFLLDSSFTSVNIKWLEEAILFVLFLFSLEPIPMSYPLINDLFISEI